MVKTKEQWQAYYRKNRERLLEMGRQRKKELREKYPKATREYERERMKRYYAENPKYRRYIQIHNKARYWYRREHPFGKPWKELSKETKKKYVDSASMDWESIG